MPAGPSLGAGRALARRRRGDLPSEMRRAAPPGGRGRGGAGRTARCVASGAQRIPRRLTALPGGPGRRGERPHGARRAAFVRRVDDGGRLGWGRRQPGDRLERRAPAALAPPPPSRSCCFSLPRPQRLCFYFDSTLRGGGRERRRGAGGCPGFCAPSPWSSRRAEGR